MKDRSVFVFNIFEVIAQKNSHRQRFSLSFGRSPVHFPHGFRYRFVQTVTCPTHNFRFYNFPVHHQFQPKYQSSLRHYKSRRSSYIRARFVCKAAADENFSLRVCFRREFLRAYFFRLIYFVFFIFKNFVRDFFDRTSDRIE